MSKAESLTFEQEVEKFKATGPYTFDELCRLAALWDGSADLEYWMAKKMHLFPVEDYAKFIDLRNNVDSATEHNLKQLMKWHWSTDELHPDLTDEHLDQLADHPDLVGSILENQLEWKNVDGPTLFTLLRILRSQESVKRDERRENKKARIENLLKQRREEIEKLETKLARSNKTATRDSSPVRK